MIAEILFATIITLIFVNAYIHWERRKMEMEMDMLGHTFTSAQSGDRNDPETWGRKYTVPTRKSEVHIIGGKVVQLNDDGPPHVIDEVVVK